MGNPATAASAGAGVGVIGAIVGAAGQLYSGKAQTNMYNYQANIATINSRIKTQDANYAIAAGETEAQQSGMRTRALVGETRAGYGAGNISTSTGSAKNVIASETAIGQANEATQRANAAKRAYGFNVGAAEDVAQAGAYSVGAGTAKTASELGAASTILGGVGQVSSKWMQASQSFGSGTGGGGGDSDPTYSNYGYGYT